MNQALPCPGCGYDLRASEPAGPALVACPECGRRYTREQILAHARQPYVGVGAILGWTLGMPMVYAVAIVIVAWVLVSSGAPPAVWWVVMIAAVALIGVFNRGLAQSITNRITRTPAGAEVSSQAGYFAFVLLLTVVQSVLTIVYPFLGCMGCCLLNGYGTFS